MYIKIYNWIRQVPWMRQMGRDRLIGTLTLTDRNQLRTEIVQYTIARQLKISKYEGSIQKQD